MANPLKRKHSGALPPIISEAFEVFSDGFSFFLKASSDLPN